MLGKIMVKGVEVGRIDIDISEPDLTTMSDKDLLKKFEWCAYNGDFGSGDPRYESIRKEILMRMAQVYKKE